MEEIREIAASYYERASQQEKSLIADFFAKLDSNRDGQVTLHELRKMVGTWLSDEKVYNMFKQLDRNCDGTLDFYEALPVYYMLHKVKMVACSGCWELLLGPYFSCSLCVRKEGLDTFDLCCACYRGGKVPHEHSYDYLLDHHTLIESLRNAKVEHQDQPSSDSTPRKNEMDELREIAKAHYQAASPQVQALAYEFFRAMDTDGDGRVNLWDFMSFMRQEGYAQMHNANFFKELDPNGYGTLGFYEVMTLYYIIKSGRPFCEGCTNFIPGIYFSCVECYLHPYYQASYNLCRECYSSRRYNHVHIEGRSAQFLDNYTLLHLRSTDSSPGLALPGKPGSSSNKWGSGSTTNAMVPAQPYYYNGQNMGRSQSLNYHSSSAVSESNNPNRGKWSTALKALDVAVTVGQIAAPAAACTIM